MTSLANKYSDVAHIKSISGIKGRLLLKASNSLFYMLDDGDILYFVPPELDAPRSSTISEIEFDGDTAKVTFSDIDDVDVASTLVGCRCLVNQSDFVRRQPESPFGLSDVEVGPGWTIRDLGTGKALDVLEIREYPSQLMLIAEDRCSKDGDITRIMIPLAEDLIEDIDSDLTCITMRLPNGLYDL